MAPFGKSFLKARLKNRTKDAEPVSGKEIQVTVCSEEKVVCGVTKHTTCADMIQALLEDHKSAPDAKCHLPGEPRDYCLVERWKGFERALPPLTRILRLWFAWGDQRPFIQFTLLKTSEFVPQPSKMPLKSKGAKPKRLEHGRGQHPQALPADKQKRMVKKAFRKLEKLHSDSRSSPGAEEIERMVQLILNQDHTIREQIRHMREMDAEVEQLELLAQRESAESEGGAAARGLEEHGEEQLQEFLFTSAGVEQLELQVQRHQELILHLSLEIDAELRRTTFPLHPGGEDGQEGAAAAASPVPSGTDAAFGAGDLEELRDELKHSLYAGVALHNQAAEIEKQLIYFDTALVSKDQERWQLAAQLSSLQIGDGPEDEPRLSPLESETRCGGGGGGGGGGGVSQTVRLKPSLSPLDITDTDSDTGISSTHSQDSLSPCLDFPPPLDTDV